MKMRFLSAVVAVSAVLATSSAALAAGDTVKPPKQDWAHDGLFGTFDRASLRRGFQVFNQVCAACHSLRLVAYRNLLDIGFTEAEVKKIAGEKEVQDGPNDEGEMFTRPARPSDKFVKPFPNPQAARASNNGAFPPDLSLIVKARIGGPDYMYALLTGYKEAPENVKMAENMAYNVYFPGHQIAMQSPLSEDGVEYADKTKASVAQMARDVTTFLAWAAEPELEERKRIGIKSILFLIVLTGMLYAVKRKVWKDVKH